MDTANTPGVFAKAAGFCPDPLAPPLFADSSDPGNFEQLCRLRLGDVCPWLSSLGARQLKAARYVNGAGGPAVVDVMITSFNSPEAAFAMFTERGLSVLGERVPEDAQTLAGYRHSLLLGQTAHALRGVDALELRYADPNATPEEQRLRGQVVLQEIAAALAEALPGNEEAPTVLRLLPTEHRRPWGVRVNYRDGFGIDGAGPVGLGLYEDGDKRYHILVASYRDEASARDIALGVRRRPGRHDLDDVPFDAFEWNGDLGFGLGQEWLIGRYQNRVAAVGSVRAKPESSRDEGPRTWLTRSEKLRLLRKTFNRR